MASMNSMLGYCAHCIKLHVYLCFSGGYTVTCILVLCILHPGCSIKFSIDGIDLGNKASREASCAFGEVCLLTGRESEHTLRH